MSKDLSREAFLENLRKNEEETARQQQVLYWTEKQLALLSFVSWMKGMGILHPDTDENALTGAYIEFVKSMQ